ncbi:hypothetical protein [Streptomyces sp. L7]|uniref:hypothetical protein n=1 Tax=Streptomyces sp. L7 TaxID=3423954 RepID=UPI003D97C878
MRLRAIGREAWRNVITGTAATRRTAVVAAAAVSLLATADLIATDRLAERAKDFVRAGASISIVTARERVDGARCDRLAQLPGVSAAGALRSTARQLAPTTLERSPIPVSDVSAGFIAVIGASTRAAGILLGPEAVDALGLTSADVLATTTRTVRVGGDYLYPEDGRRPGLSYVALAPAIADQPFDECWIDVWPAQDMTGALLSTVLLASDDEDPPTIVQLNPTMGRSFDGPSLFAERITRAAGPCAALIGLVLGFFGVRSRRLAFASALHAGASRGDLLSIVGAETLAWGVVSAVLALPVVALLGAVFAAGAESSLVIGVPLVCALWLSGFVGQWWGVRTIREKHLFRYFKER